MAQKEDEKSYYIPKKLIGELVSILLRSTDPANVLRFTSATIAASRALMLRMLESQLNNPEQIDACLKNIFQRMIEIWNVNQIITEAEYEELHKMLKEALKVQSDGAVKYDIELYRDILYCDDLMSNWHAANKRYIQDKSSWHDSDAALADIHIHLLEIIVRHSLMQMPYGDSFNLDQHGTDTGNIQEMLQKLDRRSNE